MLRFVSSAQCRTWYGLEQARVLTRQRIPDLASAILSVSSPDVSSWSAKRNLALYLRTRHGGIPPRWGATELYGQVRVVQERLRSLVFAITQ